MNIRAKIFGGTALDEEPLIPAKKPKGARFDQLDSISPKRETRQRCDSRHEDRHRLVGEHAWITYNGEDHEVELINLSGGGAMISGPFEPLLWDRLDLHLGEHGTIECAVRWIREEHFGLEFAHETQLDWPSDEVAVILRNVIERTFPHIEFPQPSRSTPPAHLERHAASQFREQRRAHSEYFEHWRDDPDGCRRPRR